MSGPAASPEQPSASRLRLGVDVGGTFTKAVAVEAASGAVVAQAVVPTTHTAAEGVTRGVVDALSALMERLPSAAQVVLVGHSTSQAVNALLEGDVAPVGIVGIGAGAERAAARRLTRIGDIALAPDRWLRTVHTFVDVSEGLSAAVVDAALGGLVDRGARVIVASAAYGVEDPEAEQFVVERARRAGLPACAGHELSGLYGLEVRTLTAAINASILPRMVETARYVEEGLRRTGVNAPLLVMRGDGGAMDLNAFRERPILTILSGPAASLAGALLHLRVADGVFLEVGGTSTNVAAIRGGRPALKYVRVMDHPTCLRSLDVRVLGVGGGSMARLRGRRLADVGPRSAHIAGFPYASFASPEEMDEPELVLVAPCPGDPADYAAVRTRSGRLFALTVTCAANALGLLRPGDYPYGSPEAARRAFAALARRLGTDADGAARAVLEMASGRVVAAVRELLREYGLDRRRTALVGGGGGAAALAPAVARRLGLELAIPPGAEVIASIGAARCLIRAEIERSLSHPTPEELATVARAAVAEAVRLGAAPGAVEVATEYLPERGAVRAVAVGGAVLETDGGRSAEDAEAVRQVAARALGVPAEELTVVGETAQYVAFVARPRRRWLRRRQPVAIVTRSGAVAAATDDGELVAGPASEVLASAAAPLQAAARRRAPLGLVPRLQVVRDGRLLDLSALSEPSQVLAALAAELQQASPDEVVLLLIDWPRWL